MSLRPRSLYSCSPKFSYSSPFAHLDHFCRYLFIIALLPTSIFGGAFGKSCTFDGERNTMEASEKVPSLECEQLGSSPSWFGANIGFHIGFADDHIHFPKNSSNKGTNSCAFKPRFYIERIGTPKRVFSKSRRNSTIPHNVYK